MIDITRIDVSPTVDEILRDLPSVRAVQRRLSIATACMDERRITVDELPQPIEHSKVRRGKDVDDGSSLDQRRRSRSSSGRFFVARATGRLLK